MSYSNIEHQMHSQQFDPLTVLSKHGKSFDFAGKFLSKKHLHSCARLYAFCRYVDDIADLTSQSDVAFRQLEGIEHDLKKGSSSDPRIIDFIHLADEKNLDLSIALELILGLKDDVNCGVLKTEKELKQYCYRVAGTVGLMMCSMLDVNDEKAMPFAIDLGIAMQLTNIARDVYEAAQAARCYIPTEWITDQHPSEILFLSPKQ